MSKKIIRLLQLNLFDKRSLVDLILGEIELHRLDLTLKGPLFLKLTGH